MYFNRTNINLKVESVMLLKILSLLKKTYLCISICKNMIIIHKNGTFKILELAAKTFFLSF